MIPYFNNHNHTAQGSNIRLLDSINTVEGLVNKAIEMGLTGLAITDHECLSVAPEANQLQDKLIKDGINFKIALGNEIYLTETRDMGQKYYHFILIAKNAIGHKMLRELSSTSWFYSYRDRGLERVPTLKSELADIIKKYGKGNLIATSACIGGELSTQALLYIKAKEANDISSASTYYTNIDNFMKYVIELFGDDFYIEVQPSSKKDQVTANKMLYKIAKMYNVKMTVGTDSHYLRPENRAEHKSYLNSKDGEREVDDFYEFAYLMSGDEVKDLLGYSLNAGTIEQIFNNSLEIENKIEYFSLAHKQDVPRVEVKDYPKQIWAEEQAKDFPNLARMYNSEDEQERYWVNQCYDKLKELGKCTKQYLDELEEEARVKTVIGQKLETNMFRYPNTLQHYIDMIWDCGSMVGAGRGSSCAALNHYLMGITQLDPIEWNLPFFRYMNDERTELGDIDLDICPSKRPLILKKIKEERSKMFNDDVPQWAKDNLGCTLVATFGTEGTKSAILTACRGYRAQGYPDGVDVDEAQYMSSLIPQERGFLWSISDVINGNSEKGRKPVTIFINEVNKYPGLLDTIKAIDGLVNHRGSHASGVILFDGDPFEHCAFMKTPSGDIITQFDLHKSEWMGLVKYDFLVTEVQDKLVQAIQLMQDDGVLEKNLTLRQIYDKYFHPNVLPLNDNRIWDALDNVSVLNTFQFDSMEGSKVARKLKPRTIQEMSSANGLMRLMGEEGEERPIDKYARQKRDISIWYREMDREGLTKEEQSTIEPYFKADYGVPPDQESLMLMLMDDNICNFTLSEANSARKIVGKKQMSKIPELHAKILKQAKSEALGKYIWKHGVGPEMGYAFSRIHALAYSFIGVQTLYIATNWNPIYWNTACLIVNSGSLETEDEDEDTGTKKAASTDYGKIAKAIGDIINAGIKVSLVDINKSGFGFKPDVENNQILFGMKALLNVSDSTVDAIISNRPYANPKDFLIRVKPTRQAMISLIKSGAFDNMMDRKLCMGWYLWENCDKKKKLTLQNLAGLMSRKLIPEDTENMIMARRIYEFNRYLKAIKKDKLKPYYNLNERAINFLLEIGYEDFICEQGNEHLMLVTDWDKVYQDWMDIYRDYIGQHKDELLQALNSSIFLEDWKKYAKTSNLSAWEMEAMCFYYHDHELLKANAPLYGIMNFNSLPEEPVVDRSFEKNGKTINLFQLSKIAGTCIAKNKPKSTVTILTTSGVVDVKFNKEYFAMFDKRISERNEKGEKHIVDYSWFDRGNMILVLGIREGDMFVAKKYNSMKNEHRLQKIAGIEPDGRLLLCHERVVGESEEEDA